MGSDPANVNFCTIGGILADNSSGMCCGVEHNAYHTLESLTFVLAGQAPQPLTAMEGAQHGQVQVRKWAEQIAHPLIERASQGGIGDRCTFGGDQRHRLGDRLAVAALEWRTCGKRHTASRRLGRPGRPARE